MDLFHGSPTVVKDQNATVCKKRAARETKTAMTRRCVADQEGAAAGQRTTVGSRPAELRRRQRVENVLGNDSAWMDRCGVCGLFPPLGCAADIEGGPVVLIGGF